MSLCEDKPFGNYELRILFNKIQIVAFTGKADWLPLPYICFLYFYIFAEILFCGYFVGLVTFGSRVARISLSVSSIAQDSLNDLAKRQQIVS